MAIWQGFFFHFWCWPFFLARISIFQPIKPLLRNQTSAHSNWNPGKIGTLLGMTFWRIGGSLFLENLISLGWNSEVYLICIYAKIPITSPTSYSSFQSHSSTSRNNSDYFKFKREPSKFGYLQYRWRVGSLRYSVDLLFMHYTQVSVLQ